MTYPSIPPLGQSWSLPSCSEIALDAPGESAWNLLLSAETAALTLATLPATKYQDNLVAVRLVGWFLKDLWEHNQNVAYERFLLQVTCNCVAAAPGEPAVELQQRYDKLRWVWCFGNICSDLVYSPTDRTPTSSASESPSIVPSESHHEHRALIMKRMAEIDDPGGRTHKQAKDDALL
ncbi:HNHc domain-containing protein [Mycena venus]|uniref:HNHc domain-containing protein n=1 Tax=Mycena venus TaxID=2733690 RepID=A0A8H6WPY1_9AGAR|nr:HNHc domain-containing protein [Mycena venus]